MQRIHDHVIEFTLCNRHLDQLCGQISPGHKVGKIGWKKRSKRATSKCRRSRTNQHQVIAHQKPETTNQKSDKPFALLRTVSHECWKFFYTTILKNCRHIIVWVVICRLSYRGWKCTKVIERRKQSINRDKTMYRTPSVWAHSSISAPPE